MSLLPIVDQTRNVLLQHEVGNNYSNAGTLALSTGRSGYSVGAFQFDFSQNKTNTQQLQLFQSLLSGTSGTTGLTQTQINQIMQGITISGGSSLVAPYLQQINQALATASGWAFTTTADAYTLTSDVQAVDQLIAVANAQTLISAGVLANGNLNPTAVAQIGAYVNQFGTNTTQLTAFLQGGTAYLGPQNNLQPYHSDGTMSLSDLDNNFFAHLYQFTQNPNQYATFLSSASSAAQASSTGTIVDIPDATIVETQEANNGVITAEASTGDGLGDTIYGSADLNPATNARILDSVIVGPTVSGETSLSIIDLGGTNSTYVISSSVIPTVLTAAAGNSASAAGLPDGVLIGLDGSTLTGGSGANLLLGLGNNETLQAGSGITQIVADGTNSLIGATGATVYGLSNASFSAAGGADVFNLGSADSLTLLGGTGYSVSGSGSTILTLANTSLSLTGNNDLLALTGTGDYLTVSGGSGSLIDITGGTVSTTSNTSLSLYGGSDTLNLGGTGNGVALLSGSGYVIYGSGDAIDITGTSATSTIVGSYDTTVVAGSGNTLDVTGSTDIVYLNNGVFNLAGNNQSVTIIGSNDQFVTAGTGNTCTFNGTNEVATLGYGTIDLDGTGQNVTVIGADDVGNSIYSGDTFGFTGSGETANLSNGNVNLNGTYMNVTITGSTVIASSAYASDTFAFSGSNETANLSNGVINLVGAYQSVTVNGSLNVANGSAGYDTFGFNGSVEAVNANRSIINLDGTYQSVTADGYYDTINSSWLYDTAGLNGNKDLANLSSGTINIDANNIGAAVQGNHDLVQGGSYDLIDNVGSYDTEQGGTHNTINTTGQYDTNADTNSFDALYGSTTGDSSDGSGDTTEAMGGSGGDGGYGYYWDFAGGATKSQITNAIDVVSKYDATVSAVPAVRAALAVADGAAAASAEYSAGFSTAATSPDEGVVWSSPIISWAFDPSTVAGAGAGTISAAEEGAFHSAITQAIGLWEAATGITMDEVPVTDNPSVTVGVGMLNTASSAVLGYTALKWGAGGFLQSSIITMEDPSQDPIVTNSNGVSSYSGTSATLLQVALHEIGHALGLADSTDPNSVMYYASGTGNTTLDATDIRNVQAIYAGQPGFSVPTGAGLLANMGTQVV